ncbi:copper amine oxidase N-terminal domain-containing protein [Paenibacillus typhae]|uniref:Copper amine oxidase N-terminal domain-containing protein n=1 Tax=Paenibacillus typhae TaxID=1174501 RepID=A0A1G9F8J8_9BACL|nr:copper amine oxidase N-terminal domain-containing protein [Paenibacillus typhae]SDK84719.1 Copper amine oxidase N-terminal domain-containing protein [Paenibacillus typhae]
MKKLSAILGTSLLALALSVPAFAAEKPISVYVNGTNLTFPAGTPYLDNNSVLVPFRVVFEKLGMQVLWDAATGTVTGTSDNLTITLKIGSKLATVNGTVKKLTVAPVSSNGTTYIPLRFVAEATGGSAVWDASSRSVQITTAVSTAASDEQAITALIRQAIQYYNEEKAVSYYNLIDDADSFSDEVASLNYFFKNYDMRTTIETLKVLNVQGDEATAYTVEKDVRAGGYYLPDERNEYLYSLVRVNGAWKISEITNQDSTVLLTKEQAMKTTDIPQGHAALIKDNLSKYFQAMTAENVDATLAQMSSYGEEYDAAKKESLQEFFKQLDLRYTLNNSNIYYYDAAAGEAAVYAETTVKEDKTGESVEQPMLFIFYQTETGGWTIDDFYYLD